MWIGFIFFKISSIKTCLSSIAGVITPYWFVFCWYMYIKDIPSFYQQFHNFFQFNPEVILNFEISDWIRSGFTLLMTVLAIINIQLHSFKDKIRSRVIFYFMFTVIIIDVILLILGILHTTEYAGIYYLLASLFAAHFFATNHGRFVIIFFYLIILTYIGLLFV